jgi:hypothetical protein
MASTYYKMSEVMDKLRKTEQQVQELIKRGKLRQYMDAGKPVFKVDEVDILAEEIVGLDMNAGGSELDLVLDETGEITLEPDEEPKNKASEGGFGLSQMGDLTSADTNVGTVGINILSGTEDAYKLTEDTKAETKVPGEADEIENLDADANLESFGSGSGLLDLSLQADDTSLGAVLDDILPSGAEGGGEIAAEPAADAAGLVGEAEVLMDAEAPAAAIQGAASGPVAAGAMAAVAPQMVAVAPEDPASTLYGAMMFLPMAALILAGIILTAAIRDVTPSLMKSLAETLIYGVSLIWYVVGGLAIAVLLFWVFSALGGAKTEKPSKEVYEKKPKKKKK